MTQNINADDIIEHCVNPIQLAIAIIFRYFRRREERAVHEFYRQGKTMDEVSKILGVSISEIKTFYKKGGEFNDSQTA